MKADPFAQLKLLDVQDLDRQLDAIRRKIDDPEQRRAAQERATAVEALRQELLRASTLVDDLVREQRRAEQDVEQVRSRRTRDQQRLDTGSVNNPKDLERLQQELVSLDRRIRELEDVELDVMERLEGAQQQLKELESRVAAGERELEETDAARGQEVAELRGRASVVEGQRADAVRGLPEDLLRLYDRLRAQKDGVGAGALRARQCGGCSLELNSGDLARIRALPSDEVVRCEECGRILVRNSESAL